MRAGENGGFATREFGAISMRPGEVDSFLVTSTVGNVWDVKGRVQSTNKRTLRSNIAGTFSPVCDGGRSVFPCIRYSRHDVQTVSL